MASTKWKLNCQSHGDVYTWSENEPTVCPRNNSDVINSDLTIQVDSTLQNKIIILEESIQTQGYFAACTKKMDILAQTNNRFDFSWDYPINVLSIKFVVDDPLLGDKFSLSVGPETIVTTLVSINGNVLTVDNVEYLKIGFILTIGTDVSVIVSVFGKTVTIKDTPRSYNFGEPIKITRYVIPEFDLLKKWSYNIGSGKIGGSYVPANTIIRIDYINNDLQLKTFVTDVEYLY
jgi:hypothetical protein